MGANSAWSGAPHFLQRTAGHFGDGAGRCRTVLVPPPMRQGRGACSSIAQPRPLSRKPDIEPSRRVTEPDPEQTFPPGAPSSTIRRLPGFNSGKEDYLRV
jgi:hypothetical protein